MKKLLIALGLAATAATASAQVSVRIGGEIAPGVYGRINLGDERPDLVYGAPRVVLRDHRFVAEPLYLYVPEQHQRRWHRYCHQYNACNRPVYFVQETWVRQYHERHNRRDDRWDDRRGPRDRDRDGVPNHRDDYPRNPHRN